MFNTPYDYSVAAVKVDGVDFDTVYHLDDSIVLFFEAPVDKFLLVSDIDDVVVVIAVYADIFVVEDRVVGFVQFFDHDKTDYG